MRVKIKQLNIDIFSNQILLGANRLFVSVYLNRDNDVK